MGDCGGCTGVAMNSDAYDAWVAADTSRVPWTSVAGKPWFVRETAYSQPLASYKAGCWLTTAWDGGWQGTTIDGQRIGFNFDDPPNLCHYCFTDYLCSRNGAEAFLATVGTYDQVVKLTASDAAAGDNFGQSVAIAGNTIVVGATQESNQGTGSAYVLRTNDGGATYAQVAKLTASDAAAGDNFGISVAIDGNTIVIGAHYDDDAGFDSGSVYVFHTSDGGVTYAQVAKLTASDAAEDDFFGGSVAIDGQKVVVGAYNLSLIHI